MSTTRSEIVEKALRAASAGQIDDWPLSEVELGFALYLQNRVSADQIVDVDDFSAYGIGYQDEWHRAGQKNLKRFSFSYGLLGDDEAPSLLPGTPRENTWDGTGRSVILVTD